MKKYFVTIAALVVFTASNAMEDQHRANQNEPISHYTLTDLQNQQGIQDTLQQSDHSSIDPVQLAFFGLQQGDNFTANQLLDRYHSGLDYLTPGQVSERYRAFSALYPHIQGDQQEVQQQAEATYFNPSTNNYDYHDYYSPEFLSESDVRETNQAMEVDDAMETGGPDYLGAISDSYDMNRGTHLFENVTPRLPHDAIVTGEDLDNRRTIQTFADSLRNNSTAIHPNYSGYPRNVWIETGPSLLILQTQQQTSQTVQSDSDNPDDQTVIGGYTMERGVQIIETPVVMLLPDGTQIAGRFRRTHRSRRIDRPNLQDNNNGDGQNNDNNGSGATGTGN